MKKQALIIILALAFAGSSCGTNRKDISSVKKTAYKYLFAMANYQVEDAIPFCTPETYDGVITTSIDLVKQMNETDPDYIKKDTPAKIEILSVEITSDTTAVAHFHKTTPFPKDQNGQIDLVLRNGKWLVHIPTVKKEAPKATPPMDQNEVRTEYKGQTIIGFKKPDKNDKKDNKK